MRLQFVFDVACALKHDLQLILNHHVPFTVLIDSESLFEITVKLTITTEKPLMINIKATRESFDRNEISSSEWISSNSKLADGLTKIDKIKCLEDQLENAKLDVSAKQRIVRKESYEQKDESRLRF